MLKVKLLFSVLIFALFLAPITPKILTRSEKRTNTEVFNKNTLSSSVVMEKETGRVLSENNGNIPLEMASTTKIATVYYALLHADPNKIVTITPEMCGIEGSSIYLQPGEKWTLKQLLYGTILRSGNDAAIAVAIATSGSVPSFVSGMNEMAKDLLLAQTNFENPHGLHSDKHYTTALDLANLTRIALSNPLFSEIVACKSVTFTRPDGEVVSFGNKNKFLTQYEGACGVKTGFTTDSGRCLVTAAKRGTMTLIGVVLNTYDMWKASEAQFNTAFATFKMQSTLGAEKKFRLSDHSPLCAIAKVHKFPLSEEEMQVLEYKISWHYSPDKIVKIGENVGEISVYLKNQLLFSEKLYTILDEKII